jgi:hypothetical protein
MGGLSDTALAYSISKEFSGEKCKIIPVISTSMV